MTDATADIAIQPKLSGAPNDAPARLQSGAYLLELSPDWIIRRASENIHRFLGTSHVTLIEEPLGCFVQAQALHDLRNLFSRLSGTTGIGRAYRVRLTHDHDRFDIAFQLAAGRVLLEAVPSSEQWFGQALGTVGGLASGLAGLAGQSLLDAAARRMRALTGFDRVTLVWAGERAESSRGGFAAPARPLPGLPPMVADRTATEIGLFPAGQGETAADAALLRAPAPPARIGLGEQGIAASLSMPFTAAGKDGEFRADSLTPHLASLELHAAAELFAQMFAMRVEMAGAN